MTQDKANGKDKAGKAKPKSAKASVAGASGKKERLKDSGKQADESRGVAAREAERGAGESGPSLGEFHGESHVQPHALDEGHGLATTIAAGSFDEAGLPEAELKAESWKKRKLPKGVKEKAFSSGGYPYEDKLDKDEYEKTLRDLQIEMQKAANWLKTAGERLVVVFEGRDAAGKGGAIARLTMHLSPRSTHIVALPKPTEVERGQWYFQRYVAHLPTRGDMTVFDRSWYNRAGVERVFGFCTLEESEKFLAEVPSFETALTRDGIRIIKIFLTIGREMQTKRLYDRWNDPLKRWKISPIDLQAGARYDQYSEAFDRMLTISDIAAAPWSVIRGNDKKRARLEVLRVVLNQLPYASPKEKNIGEIDRRIVHGAAEYLARGGEN